MGGSLPVNVCSAECGGGFLNHTYVIATEGVQDSLGNGLLCAEARALRHAVELVLSRAVVAGANEPAAGIASQFSFFGLRSTAAEPPQLGVALAPAPALVELTVAPTVDAAAPAMAASAAEMLWMPVAMVAVGETVLLLHPPLPLVGLSIWIKGGCHQNDSLADG